MPTIAYLTAQRADSFISSYPGASNHKTYPYPYGTRLTTRIHNEKSQTTAVIVEGEV